MSNKNLKTLNLNLFYAIFDHFCILYTDLDPVKDAKFYHLSKNQLFLGVKKNTELQSKIKNNRLAYLFPLLTMSYIAFSDLIYILLNYHDHFELSELPDLLQPLTILNNLNFLSIFIHKKKHQPAKLKWRGEH